MAHGPQAKSASVRSPGSFLFVDLAEMHLAAFLRQCRLFLPLSIAGALFVGLAVVTAVATDAFFIQVGRLVRIVDRFAAGAA